MSELPPVVKDEIIDEQVLAVPENEIGEKSVEDLKNSYNPDELINVDDDGNRIILDPELVKIADGGEKKFWNSNSHRQAKKDRRVHNTHVPDDWEWVHNDIEPKEIDRVRSGIMRDEVFRRAYEDMIKTVDHDEARYNAWATSEKFWIKQTGFVPESGREWMVEKIYRPYVKPENENVA